MNLLQKLLDLTYWRYKRSRRVCAGCGERSNQNKGKVNYGFAFEKPKRLYHMACHSIENERRRTSRR